MANVHPRPRVGVALCGAELAGVAHAGVLCALEEMGVQIDHVAGSSSGSLVAALYAYGYRYRDFDAMVRRFPGLLLSDYGFPVVTSVLNIVRKSVHINQIPVPNGLLRGHKLLKYIRNLLADRKPQMDYSLVATDLFSTKAVVFTNHTETIEQGTAYRSTDVPREVLGSCAMPGMLTPVPLRGWLLVDGGVRDIVPVQALRNAGCDRVIAIDVHQLPATWRPVTTVDVMARSMATLLDEAKQTSDLAGRDVFVLRPDLEWTSWWAARKPMAHNLHTARTYTHQQASELMRFLRRSFV
ncbi:patatin-like phospholipase family protein [Alicyclobacillus sp. ALC3]|uniref:patatin-like phospholipase family protein n=1 Tax=Alicyclobacillus sp. ALC3 TaxID=2796143 RepID=UPI002378036D|nr:patatin-like phospholipase family protein [Alicyclobacillus sp. ALC3]WDL97275.1 patatin-like phospholipase family protein [Alicyclobacillus sp. ALC3]